MQKTKKIIVEIECPIKELTESFVIMLPKFDKEVKLVIENETLAEKTKKD